MDERDSVLASGFIPTEPEEITAQWLFEVINQYREVIIICVVLCGTLAYLWL